MMPLKGATTVKSQMQGGLGDGDRGAQPALDSLATVVVSSGKYGGSTAGSVPD